MFCVELCELYCLFELGVCICWYGGCDGSDEGVGVDWYVVLFVGESVYLF